MKKAPSFDDIFAVMAAASIGNSTARIPVPDDPQLDDPPTKLAIALNVLLDNLAFHADSQKISRSALSNSLDRNTAIVETSLDAIVSIDSEGNITEFNPAAERTFGFAKTDVLGKSFADLMIPPGARDAHKNGLTRFLATGEGPVLGKRLELSALRRDGTEFPVELAIVRIGTSSPPTFTGHIRDISARKAAESELRASEEQLRQAQKMEAVGRLAGGIAHDFNNLLSVILSYSETLLVDLRPQAPMHDEIDEIRQAALRAATLTRQLLMFSRQQVFQPKVLDLNELVVSLDKMLQRILGADVDLVSLPTVPLGMVRADSGSIEQVLMNLVVNARDAMPTGGKLTIETRNVVLDDSYARAHLGVKPGPHVMLAVSDTGIGMDKATQARIFEPFFTTKDRDKGTGLGLSTVFGIVEQSGGHIWLYSELGKGSTFKLYLPSIDAPADQLAPVLTSRASRGSETILLVEDNDQVRLVARTILRRNGYHVIEAGNAKEAHACSERHSGVIDLLLSDVIMPQLSGPELAKQLGKTRPAMKVLCMSGYTDDSIVRHGVLEARIAYLQKPFTPATLTAKVRDVLDGAPAPANEP